MEKIATLLKKTFIVFWWIVFVLSMIIVGWYGNEAYESWNYQRKYDGLFIENVNYSKAEQITHSRDKRGDWVCVNVRDMSYERALEVCNHEVGHEIFAEFCEENIEKCIGLWGEELK